MNINEAIIMARAEADGDATNMPCAATTDPLFIQLKIAKAKVYSWIREADGTWQFDDSNHTDFPIWTTTLVSGQEDYTLDREILEVEAVEALDKDGNYYPLKQIDIEKVKAMGLTLSEYETTAGKPVEYDLQGSSIILKPAPDAGVSVTLASGLRIRGKRSVYDFSTTEVSTGTANVGFASHLDPVVPKIAAQFFVKRRHPERLGILLSEIGDNPPPQPASGYKAAVLEFYSKRNKDERTIMTPKKILYI